MNTSQLLLTGWTWHPVILLIAVAASAFYLAAFGMSARFGYFVSALGVVLLALVSPIAALADGYLFSAHMLQHILLLLIAPALLLLGLPPSFSTPKLLQKIASPVVCWISGVGAMWLWHAPSLCNSAVSSRGVYAFQTLSLLALGSMFWLQLLAPRHEQRLNPLAAVIYLFTACVACSVLGIIFTFSPVTVCSIYQHPVERLGLLSLVRDRWGISAVQDQQIGGLLMWVPMCLVYAGAILGQLARFFGEPATPPLNPGRA